MYSTDLIAVAVIIATITLLFTVFFVRDIRKNNKASRYLNELESFTGEMAAKESIVISQCKLPVQQWAKGNLVTEIVNDQLQINMTPGGFVTKYPVNNLLGDIDIGTYKSVPALLTSIGILGTFLGVTMGLSQFDTSSIGQDSASLLISAASLLEGMKTAFYTSLAGLFFSAIFMIRLQWTRSSMTKKRQALTDKLSLVVIEANALGYLQQIANNDQSDLIASQKEAAGAMTALGQTFEGVFSQFGKAAETLDGDKIARAVSNSVDLSIKQHMVPVLNELKNEISTLKDIKEENQQQLLTDIIGLMRNEIVLPVTQAMNTTAQAVEQSNSVNERVNKNVELVLQNMTGTLDTLNTFQADTMNKLEAFAVSLKDILDTFKDEASGTMSTITTQVDSVLNKSIEGMAAQRAAFESSAQQASQAFKGIGEDIEAALDSRKVTEQQLFSAMETRLTKLLDDSTRTFESQSTVLKNIGNEAGAVMDKAGIELAKGLGDIDVKVSAMANTVQHELDQFRVTYQDKLGSFLDQQNKLLEDSLGRQRDGLDDVIEKFRTTFESEYQTRNTLLQELTAQHQQLLKSAATIENLAKAVGLGETAKMSELQDTAMTIGSQVGHLKKEYAQASKQFAEVTESMPKAMSDYITRANSSFEQFFNDFDTSASAIHNKLAQAADFLIQERMMERDMKKAEVS